MFFSLRSYRLFITKYSFVCTQGRKYTKRTKAISGRARILASIFRWQPFFFSVDTILGRLCYADPEYRVPVCVCVRVRAFYFCSLGYFSFRDVFLFFFHFSLARTCFLSAVHFLCFFNVSPGFVFSIADEVGDVDFANVDTVWLLGTDSDDVIDLLNQVTIVVCHHVPRH